MTTDAETAATSNETAKTKKHEETESSIVDMMMSRQFVSIYVMAAFSFFLGTFTVSNYKAFGEVNNLGENFLTTIGSIGAFFATIRFIWSGLLDTYSYRKVYGALLCVQIVSGICIVLFSHIKWVYAFFYSMILFCEGGHFTLVPNILKQIFGPKATQLYGFAFSYTGFTSLLLLGLQMTFLSAKTYKYFFMGGALTSGIALLMLIFWFTDAKYESKPPIKIMVILDDLIEVDSDEKDVELKS